MKFDMIACGVGGQGILSISFVVDNAALDEEMHFKQSEVHGMAQRGGAVMSHLRVSEGEIFSDLIPAGSADLVLSMEPLEAMRYLHYLAPEGKVVSSISPFVNIPNYPDQGDVVSRIQSFARHTLVNGEELARAAGSNFAQNIVMLGAASHLVPMENKTLEKYISILFKAKGEKIVNVNLNAFRYGALAGTLYRQLRDAKLPLNLVAVLATKLFPAEYTDSDINWISDLCKKDGISNFTNTIKERRGLLTLDDAKKSTLNDMDFNSVDVEKVEALF